ncbi:hypothetical protein ACWKW4_04675 [Hydrogenophaga borbori]|uniref:hypothetical protein n=1 Tax=Hydrogenophaga borbori TaxID=2294117 RepID=UPI00301DDB0A
MSAEDVDAGHRALAQVELQSKQGNPLARRMALLALEDLESPASQEPRHQAFLELCSNVAEGYRDLSDDQIAALDETPRLMRYLISAMESYSTRVSSSGGRASDRYKRLAEAFGVSGEHGGNHRGLWSDAREKEVVWAYSTTLHGQADPGSPAARLLAFEAAYDAAFGPDSEGGREERERKKNRAQLVRLLLKHGYLWPGAFGHEHEESRGQGESS